MIRLHLEPVQVFLPRRGFYFDEMCQKSADELWVRQRDKDLNSDKDLIAIINCQNGDFPAEMESQCSHSGCTFLKHPQNPQCLLEACSACTQIRMYNFSDKTTKAVFSGFNSTAICRGPENSFFASSSNTVFSVSDSNNVSELQWQNDELVLVRTFAPQSSTFGHVETMSYSAHLRAVIQGGYRTFRAFTFPAETEALSLTEIVLPGPLKSIQNLFNSSSLFRSNKHFNIKSLSSDAAGQLYLSLHAWTGNFEPGVYRLDPVTGQTLCLFHTFPHGLCLHNSHGLFAMEGDRIERYNLSVVSYRKSTPL